MKDWAVEKGATHYTHWFQPMTGITAEKHESFLSPAAEGGIIMEFSGKELIHGESDASSFPSGGLRATFEARGYTAWDPTSYAFIKDGVLCIPTAFCSYTGDALDKKTPLLRSMEVINRESLRILRLMGDTDTSHVSSTAGAEQEYFLVDRAVAEGRRDLKFCGRTLFGASPPKGQEMEDHYYGSIRPRVKAFMEELNTELWRLGIHAKTEHNETAPGQHELAPVFTTVNIAVDHNQLTMEILKKVAERHGLLCLLHEKPFAGVNGSGKHNNWSLCTDLGKNLLDPGEHPQSNLSFLTFMVAVLCAVDDYQDLLRISVAGAGNDHRLGGDEAPPAIISVFLGDEITAVLAALEENRPYDPHKLMELKAGVKTIPSFYKDNTDRNRTSPFAFTGNKFEFRMPGASLSIAGPNFVLNTIIADALREIADRLDISGSAEAELRPLLAELLKKHRRIIFNGNNYAKEWVAEAERRGLSNLVSTAEAVPHFLDDKNVGLFVRYGILSEAEIRSRYEIIMEGYCKTLQIEALTMAEIARKDILPAASSFLTELASAYSGLIRVCPEACANPGDVRLALIKKLSGLTNKLFDRVERLEFALSACNSAGSDVKAMALHCRDQVYTAMQELRAAADDLEVIVGRKHWPMPDYGDLLFSV
jgi:glutamine synthetase